MNRINPVYIVVLLFFVLVAIIYQDHKFKKLIKQKEQRILFLEEKAREISTLKNYWGDKRVLKRRIEAILKTSFVAKFIKNRENKRDKIRVYFVGVDAQNADRIANKIFNAFVKIGALKIERKDKNHINMEVEFIL